MTPDELKALLQKPLREIAAALGVSHETARHIRNHHAGKCGLCGKNAPHPKSKMCLKCLQRLRRRQRIALGNEPWQPGSRGVPPIELRG